MEKFSWSVSGSFAAYAYLANLKLDEPYKNVFACAKVFKYGRPKTTQLFGPEVSIGSPACAPISYGHIICLGSPVFYPEDSEPGVRPIYKNIKDGIKALQREVDFSQNSLFQNYWQTYQYLKNEFPEEKFGFNGFGVEGPITTAVLLRGQDFYLDVYDTPDETEEFLHLLTKSIINFKRFVQRLNNGPEISSESSSMTDDFSSLISPDLWPEFVIPFWEKYYQGLTTGKRYIHVENLKPGHLKYLKKIGIRGYDPSVSPQLNPAIIKKEINIPFSWRLPSFELDRMNGREIKEWIYRNRAAGADSLFYIIEKNTCFGNNPEKVKVFIKTCQEIT